eukprot:GSChrysophyteH1.ASY1.ANO1.3.1 assembled CDS
MSGFAADKIQLEDSDYEALLSSELRRDLYKDINNNKTEFQNPLYKLPKAMIAKKKKSDSDNTGRLKDFLVSISSFSDFSETQLLTLEQKAVIKRYNPNDIIFKQGEEGDNFYVIHEGTVDVLIQDKLSKVDQGQYGRVVNRLTGGCYFGERALMTSEKRAATIKVVAKSVFLVFSRAVYEEVISGSNALIGKDISDHVDWSKDHETRSLYKHVERILEIDDPSKKYTPEIKSIRYNLATIFTPELLSDEIVSRMVITVQKAVHADRVGLFVLNEDRRRIRLPVRGLAGAIVESNMAENIVDAYKDPRFDGTMDRRTGYTTRQVLGVPVKNPINGDAIGVLQVNNRMDNPSEPFGSGHQKILELAAEQLSELLHNRAEIFTSITSSGLGKTFGQGAGDGMTVLDSNTVKTPFVVELFTLSLGTWGEDVRRKQGLNTLVVTIQLFLALTPLCDAQEITLEHPSSSSEELKVRTSLEFSIAVRDLPRAARIMFKLKGRKTNGKHVSIGWAAAPIFDFKGCLDSMIDLRLFPGDIKSPIKTTLSNTFDSSSPSVSMILASDLVLNENQMTPRIRIIHSMPNSSGYIAAEETNLTAEETSELARLQRESFNPISKFTRVEKEYLWDLRYQILDRADLLPAFIVAMQWKDSDRVQELYALLDLWEVPEPSQALLLLDRRFMDPKVRAYAIHCLEALHDDELSLFSSVHNTDVKRRFVALLQIYIRNCDSHRVELGRQVFVMKRLESIAESVANGPSKSERLNILRELLQDVVLPTEFQLPLNPHLKVKGIDVDKCRVMESKKKPLWLTLHNAKDDADDIVLMLKVGDDLRQDALVMQLLRVMNLLWQKDDLDMQMMLYDCISTGDERGLLQVVLNSTTLGSIILHHTDKYKKEAGKKSWIREQCEKDEEVGERTEHFIISSAAYCVASYVLGLGDRHNDNLMMTKFGHFFHIDFGHILGNFKSKYGVKRERAPFVFTYAMKEVMNDEEFEKFKDLCCWCYNILRKNASTLVSLVSLAIPCELPELQTEEDVVWIYEKLQVHLSEDEAATHFRKTLDVALATRFTRLNDVAHMLAHA